jgi:hypothetical protein
MQGKSRRSENFCDVDSSSPQFVRIEHTPRQVVPIYFPGTGERVGIWFSRTKRRQNIQILFLVLMFGLAGGIMGGITGVADLQSRSEEQIGLQPEETSLTIAPDEEPIPIIRAPTLPRIRRRAYTRQRPQPGLVDTYRFIDFVNKRANHAGEDNDDGGGY